MALVKCYLCGKNVNTTAKNYVFANGLHQHKKCPKASVLTDEENADRLELNRTIEWVFLQKNLSDRNGLNWPLVSRQQKAMRDAGYSYKDQLFGLKFVVERDGGYWGFGRVEKFMVMAMEHKSKLDEYESKKAEQRKARVITPEQKLEEQSEQRKAKIVSKPSILDVGEKPDFL